MAKKKSSKVKMDKDQRKSLMKRLKTKKKTAVKTSLPIIGDPDFGDPEKTGSVLPEDKYGKDLYNRCRKKIGMTDVQISAHPDAESLLQYANGIHPGSNVDARVKEGVRPEPMKFEENMPDSFTLESAIEAKFIKTNREHFDRSNLQAFLRRINRRYGPFKPVRIVQDMSFKVVHRELVTKFTIYYK